MSVETRIRDKLVSELEPIRLDVINESELHAGHRGSPGTGDSHFRIVVVSAAFAELSRLARHRRVNEILAEDLAPGGIHALAIHAFAPGEDIKL